MIPGAPAFATPRLSGDPKLAFLSVQFEGHGASIRDVWGPFVCQNASEKGYAAPWQNVWHYIAGSEAGD
jgi:hypothetical protein